MDTLPAYLVVTPFFPGPTSWSGSYCFDFVRALRRENVLVFKPGDGTDYEIGGVTVHTFKTLQLPSNILPFLFARRNTRSFLNKVKRVLQTLTAVKVCHAHTANFAIYALAAKREFGCKTLLHHHDPQSFGIGLGVLAHNWIHQLIEFPLVRHYHEQIDCHVFISEMVKRSFLSAPDASWTIYDDYRRQMRGPAFFHCRLARIKRSIILHNGVDTSIFHPKDEVEVGGRGGQRNGSSSEFVIGCIGNFIDWKDQATLIKAVALLKESVKVIFVGSGPTLQHCKELANSIVGLHLQPTPIFEFRTEVPHEQLAGFYHSIDLFVLPSYFEGFGCVFTEAYASGVPFITCKGQGMDDLVREDERNLWLCKPRDAEDLAAKIAHYIAHRPVQHLSGPISFDDLMPQFIKEVETL